MSGLGERDSRYDGGAEDRGLLRYSREDRRGALRDRVSRRNGERSGGKCVDKTTLQECAVKVINKTKLTEVYARRAFHVERSGVDPDGDRHSDAGAA